MALNDVVVDAAKVSALQPMKLTTAIYDKRREALRAALTEALAQPIDTSPERVEKSVEIKRIGCVQHDCAECKARAAQPQFTGLPKRKLDMLLADGYQINGVSFQRKQVGSTWKHGFITTGGMVGWWHGEDEQSAQPAREPLSDEQIHAMWIVEMKKKVPIHLPSLEFARAIERAHGIGGDK